MPPKLLPFERTIRDLRNEVARLESLLNAAKEARSKAVGVSQKARKQAVELQQELSEAYARGGLHKALQQLSEDQLALDVTVCSQCVATSDISELRPNVWLVSFTHEFQCPARNQKGD